MSLPKDMPEELRPKWPDNSEPTALEWVDWFTGLPTGWQSRVAEVMLTRQRYDTRCVQNDHVGRIRELSSRLVAAESAAARYRDALIVIRSKTEDGLRR